MTTKLNQTGFVNGTPYKAWCKAVRDYMDDQKKLAELQPRRKSPLTFGCIRSNITTQISTEAKIC